MDTPPVLNDTLTPIRAVDEAGLSQLTLGRPAARLAESVG
jgi:hypothetical protein